MKKTGLVLFLALAALFFVTAGDAAAQRSQLNYSEKYDERIECEGTTAEDLFCEAVAVKDESTLLGSLVLEKAVVDDIVEFPDAVVITATIFNPDLDALSPLFGLETVIDLSPASFDCLDGGFRTCRGFDADGNYLNARATRNTIRFTWKGLADLSFQMAGLLTPPIPNRTNIGAVMPNLAATVEIQTLNFFLTIPLALCFDLPVQGTIGFQTVTARDQSVLDLLKTHFRAQNFGGPCTLPVVAQ